MCKFSETNLFPKPHNILKLEYVKNFRMQEETPLSPPNIPPTLPFNQFAIYHTENLLKSTIYKQNIFIDKWSYNLNTLPCNLFFLTLWKFMSPFKKKLSICVFGFVFDKLWFKTTNKYPHKLLLD
jgi:hypothetical protein